MDFYVKNLTPKNTAFTLDLADGFYADEVCVYGLQACDQDGQPFGDAVRYFVDSVGAYRLHWHEGLQSFELIRFETENEAFRSCLGDVVMIHGPRFAGGRWNLQFIESIPVEASARIVLADATGGV